MHQESGCISMIQYASGCLGSSMPVDVRSLSSPEVVFQCQGKFLSFEHKRVICDADGMPIFVITEPLMQIDDKQVVHRVTPEGKPSEELFRVGSNFGNTAQYTQNLKNTKGHAITLNGKMSLVSMKGGIWLGPAGKGRPLQNCIILQYIASVSM